jgi:hypothetical protein
LNGIMEPSAQWCVCVCVCVLLLLVVLVVVLLTIHSRSFTQVELAVLNGMGVKKGKSNWSRAKTENMSQLYMCMPPEMMLPLDWHRAEIRCTDIDVRTPQEFHAFLRDFTGPHLRFLDPHFAIGKESKHTGPVRLSMRRQDDIARCLLI